MSGAIDSAESPTEEAGRKRGAEEYSDMSTPHMRPAQPRAPPKKPRPSADAGTDFNFTKASLHSRALQSSSSCVRTEPSVSGEPEFEDSSSAEEAWVQCEGCCAWRRLPNHVGLNSLPELWCGRPFPRFCAWQAPC